MSILPGISGFTPLPAEFIKRIEGIYGEKGIAWIAELPRIVARYAQQWELEVGEPFALSYNYVVRATRLVDSLPVVLKLGVPCLEQKREASALLHFGARGAVPVLEADIEGGALLMPRVFPGETLEALPDQNDDEATRAACVVMRGLHAVPSPLPGVCDWLTAEDWGKDLTDFNAHKAVCGFADLWDRAAHVYAELLASSDAPVLLHGDLHHGNILHGENGFVAIDAKGLWGESAYEAGAMLRNPHGFAVHPEAAHLTTRRLDIFADELGHDRERLRLWGFSQAVLSVIWYLEDGGTLGGSGGATLEFARLLEQA